MDQYIFERVSQKNLKDLAQLFKAAFSFKAEMDFLVRKFDTNVFGASYIGFIAYDKQTKVPAAYYGVFPARLVYEGKTLLAAQSGDTMTHPDHRGKGLFITLAKMTYELAAKEKVEFIYGFPNENSYPGFVKKLNWKHYSNINNYRIETGAIPLDKAVKKFSFLDPLFRKKINKSFHRIKSEVIFENSMDHQMPGMGNVLHDKDLFAYKQYYESHVITLAGKKVWLKVDGRLWVGDIEFCSENEFENVTSALKAFAKKNHCATVHFSVMENSLYDQYLKKKLPLYAQSAVAGLDLSNKFDITKFAYQAADFDTF